MLDGAKVLVTGGNGFFGRHIANALDNEGVETQVSGRYYDLTVESNVRDMIAFYKPDMIIHAAGFNGGIAFNKAYPAEIFSRNTLMALNLLGSCSNKVKKVVSVVASCAYPAYGHTFRSDDFFSGEPHPSVASHAYAKRNLQLASQFYHKQYGLNAVCVCPATMYGPGDSFCPFKSHVIGAMIGKIAHAYDNQLDSVTFWGTGEVFRQFVYVEDGAYLTVQALTQYDNCYEPLNIAGEGDIPLKELAKKIASVMGYEGKIEWDGDARKNGVYRKQIISEVLDELYVPDTFEFTSLEDGLKKTVDHYYRVRDQEQPT